jgi:NAD(P)-dependent dehydrogenase (short-subunit alcohol dehydrogenase family)
MKSIRLQDKVALVTGAGTGIGAATACRFASEGATVVLVGRRLAKLEEVADRIERDGGHAMCLVGDVSVETEARMIIKNTIERFGNLHIAFNNAGILGRMVPITEMSASEFDAVVAVNLRGTWLMVREQLSAMIKAGTSGSIINTSSSTAHAASAGTTAYAPSKAALNTMTQALAMEAGPYGIRVNNISPGAIETEMFEISGGDSIRDTVIAHTPLRRLGQTGDIANAALWLASDESTFVTGQTILVDGGFALPGMR